MIVKHCKTYNNSLKNKMLEVAKLKIINQIGIYTMRDLQLWNLYYY